MMMMHGNNYTDIAWGIIDTTYRSARATRLLHRIVLLVDLLALLACFIAPVSATTMRHDVMWASIGHQSSSLPIYNTLQSCYLQREIYRRRSVSIDDPLSDIGIQRSSYIVCSTFIPHYCTQY